jgi:hypothetical protein
MSLLFVIWGLWPDKIIEQTEDLTDQQRSALKRQKFTYSLMMAVVSLAIVVGPSPTALAVFSIFIGLLGLFLCFTYLRRKVVYIPMGIFPSLIWRGNIAIIFCFVMIPMILLMILSLQISVPLFWNFYEPITGQ